MAHVTTLPTRDVGGEEATVVVATLLDGSIGT
jgi:hypothetical protein